MFLVGFMNINDNPILKVYSLKRTHEHNITDINKIINNHDNKISNKIKSNFNNNININININNDSLNKKLDKIISGKSSINTPKIKNKKLNSYNYISSQPNIKCNKNNIIRKFPTYTNFIEMSNLDNKNKEGELIIPSSAKIIKKYISHKYHNINHKNNYNRDEYDEMEEEREDNDIDIKDKYEHYNEDKYNIYNINLNFISDKRNNHKNVEYFNTDDNTMYLNDNKTSNQKSKNKTYK